MHNYRDCSFCGGEVKSSKVELDYRYKGKLYIFKDVIAGVYKQCVFYNRKMYQISVENCTT